MNTQDSPFGGLDKLLLTSTQSKKQHQGQSDLEQGNKETRKLPSKQVRLLKNKETSQKVGKNIKQSRSPVISFTPDVPVKQRLYRKQTFELSKEDVDFLDQVKFQLRKLGVTKNEIVRTALELLAKDYQGNKETSFLVRKFAGK